MSHKASFCPLEALGPPGELPWPGAHCIPHIRSIHRMSLGLQAGFKQVQDSERGVFLTFPGSNTMGSVREAGWLGSGWALRRGADDQGT